MPILSIIGAEKKELRPNAGQFYKCDQWNTICVTVDYENELLFVDIADGQVIEIMSQNQRVPEGMTRVDVQDIKVTLQ